MILSAEALVSDLQNYEKNHPEIAQKKANLGVMFYTYCTLKGTTEFLEGATELLEDALSSNTKNFGKTHITVANVQFNLAFVYQDLKRTKEAYTLLKEAYDTYLTIFGENHPNTIAVKEILDFIPPQ